MQTVEVRIDGHLHGCPRLDEFMFDRLTESGWKPGQSLMWWDEPESKDTLLIFVKTDPEWEAQIQEHIRHGRKNNDIH